MNEIVKIIIEIAILILAVIGLYVTVYYLFCREKLYMSASYLFIDADEVGETLEYYIRKVQTNFNAGKIILYSKSGENKEVLNICKILSRDFSNVACLDNPNLQDFMRVLE